MNERIRELAEHAELPNPHTPGYWTFNNSQLEFFAELIVKQCAMIADTDDKNPAGCGWITKTKGQNIKQYFGVEE